ncbi:MAG: 16S rRNA (guanine(966)-N(2))-methyltransferase RsmD [Pseudomonadota bacterium]
MRIVAGQFKGRAIQAPKRDATRPTSDRARESVFNILAHADWAPSLTGARVIDLFAGSGALGFEALSRGASFCLFVETAPAARGAIRNNIEALGLFGTTRIHRRSATDLGQKSAGTGEGFDFAFIDPPYHKGLIAPCLKALKEGDWLLDKALIVAETAADETLTSRDWEVISERTIGAAKVWFLKRA